MTIPDRDRHHPRPPKPQRPSRRPQGRASCARLPRNPDQKEPQWQRTKSPASPRPSCSTDSRSDTWPIPTTTREEYLAALNIAKSAHREQYEAANPTAAQVERSRVLRKIEAEQGGSA
jgi:hypothetical protein